MVSTILLKKLKIGVKLPRLQNILRAKMMAIHHTLKLLSPHIVTNQHISSQIALMSYIY